MERFSKILRLPSEVKHLAEVEGMVEELLGSGLLNDAVYGNVIVAATEGVLNGITHGNQGDASKTTTVHTVVNDNLLEITIEDEGNGFDYEHLPDPTAPENLEKVNGRGIFIIKSLADEVEFQRNGATLIMRFNLDVKELVEA